MRNTSTRSRAAHDHLVHRLEEVRERQGVRRAAHDQLVQVVDAVLEGGAHGRVRREVVPVGGGHAQGRPVVALGAADAGAQGAERREEGAGGGREGRAAEADGAERPEQGVEGGGAHDVFEDGGREQYAVEAGVGGHLGEEGGVGDGGRRAEDRGRGEEEGAGKSEDGAGELEGVLVVSAVEIVVGGEMAGKRCGRGRGLEVDLRERLAAQPTSACRLSTLCSSSFHPRPSTGSRNLSAPASRSCVPRAWGIRSSLTCGISRPHRICLRPNLSRTDSGVAPAHSSHRRDPQTREPRS